jgi:hypothetical protein
VLGIILLLMIFFLRLVVFFLLVVVISFLLLVVMTLYPPPWGMEASHAAHTQGAPSKRSTVAGALATSSARTQGARI